MLWSVLDDQMPLPGPLPPLSVLLFSSPLGVFFFFFLFFFFLVVAAGSADVGVTEVRGVPCGGLFSGTLLVS